MSTYSSVVRHFNNHCFKYSISFEGDLVLLEDIQARLVSSAFPYEIVKSEEASEQFILFQKLPKLVVSVEFIGIR